MNALTQQKDNALIVKGGGGGHLVISRVCPERKKQVLNQNMQPIASHNEQAASAIDIQYKQQFRLLTYNVSVSDILNVCGNNSNNSGNVTPNLPSTIANTKNFREHEWEIKFFIAKEFTEMIAKGNPDKFLDVMNIFLISNELSPILVN